MKPVYEIRNGAARIEHETGRQYMVYELWAIHSNGGEVFVCAHFGGCSHMSIYQLKKYFESLPIEP